MLRQQTIEVMAKGGYRSPTILVVARDVTQAKFLWRDIKHKYEHLGRVRFVSNHWHVLDGLNPDGMIIIRIGEYWLNKSNDSDAIRWFEQLGAKAIYEDS